MDLTLNGIPVGYVDKNFIMDPKTDDMIYGTALQEGMIVLIGESILRDDPADFFNKVFEVRDSYRENRLRENSRWCIVTQLRQHGNVIQFIGVYEDGTKYSRSYADSYAWYVKK